MQDEPLALRIHPQHFARRVGARDQIPAAVAGQRAHVRLAGVEQHRGLAPWLDLENLPRIAGRRVQHARFARHQRPYVVCFRRVHQRRFAVLAHAPDLSVGRGRSVHSARRAGQRVDRASAFQSCQRLRFAAAVGHENLALVAARIHAPARARHRAPQLAGAGVQAFCQLRRQAEMPGVRNRQAFQRALFELLGFGVNPRLCFDGQGRRGREGGRVQQNAGNVHGCLCSDYFTVICRLTLPVTTASRAIDSLARTVSGVSTIGFDARPEVITFSTDDGTAASLRSSS